MNRSDTVRLERSGGVALVTLNRPERRNAVTLEMCAAFHETVQHVAASDARVLVLRGAGDDFCVGADVAAARTEDGAATTGEHDIAAICQSAALLHTMPQVTVAAIDGGCAGAGMGWALACDLRFGTARARYSTAFLNVGVSGDMGVAWSLNRILGGAKARELLFFPGRFGGEEAHSLGLVTRLFAPEVLHEQTLRLAEQLAARDPLALRLIKENCLSAESMPIGEYIAVETARHLQTTARPELGRLMAEGYARRKGS